MLVSPRAQRLATALAAVGAFFAASAPGTASAASDPYLTWWTIETPHFRVHYDKSLEPIAERVAALGEGINDELGPALGWSPTQVTEIVLSDTSDDANGSATALPRPHMCWLPTRACAPST